MLEDTKWGLKTKPRMGKNIGGARNTTLENYSGSATNQKYTSSSGGKITKLSSGRDSNKKLILNKDFQSVLIAIKDQNDTQSFLYQFNLNAQGESSPRTGEQILP